MSQKKLLIGFGSLVGFVVLLYVVGMLLPTTFKIEKSVTITAQDRGIFAYTADLNKWNEWTVWAKKDPNMQTQTSDPSYGVGATYSWDSKKMGKGTAKITRFTLNRSVAWELSIEGAPTSQFQIDINAGRSSNIETKWTAEGVLPNPPFQRLISYFFTYMLGKDLKSGLENLKGKVESLAAEDIKPPWEARPAETLKNELAPKVEPAAPAPAQEKKPKSRDRKPRRTKKS